MIRQLKGTPQHTAGFSIVELMISLLLGSALLILSFNLYFSTKQSEMMATTILNTQTEARNAMHHIRQAIEHAGFVTNVTLQETNATYQANTRFSAGEVISVDDQADASSTLIVRMQGDKDRPIRSCDGEDILSINENQGETWYEFYVDSDALLCQVYIDGAATSDLITLAAPVAALKLRIFSESNASNKSTTFIRTDSADVSAQETVKGVQVQLVVRSSETIRSDISMTTVPMTGFSDLEFENKHYYINNNRYFIAQNQ